MADKATKSEANYRSGSIAQHCGVCTMFQRPHGCTSVIGMIDAHDVCDYFKSVYLHPKIHSLSGAPYPDPGRNS